MISCNLKREKKTSCLFLTWIGGSLGKWVTLGEGLPLFLILDPGADRGPEAIVHTGQEFCFCLIVIFHSLLRERNTIFSWVIA